MDGVLVINKPKGYSSHDVVNIVRKNLNIKQVGHAGTLDPNATGVLPILIGKATKISKYMIEHDKTYVATIKLGEKTDTADSEGKVIKSFEKIPDLSEQHIKKALKGFLGKQMQVPPVYSAIKINGKKAYEYARAGKVINIEPRNIEIYSINLNRYENDQIEIEVECSKGTYIRTLCEDIAERLNTVGYMKELIRTKVNDFNLEQAIEIEEIEKNKIQNRLILINNIFKNKEKIVLNQKEVKPFLNGVLLTKELEDNIYRIYNKENFIGLGIVKKDLLKRDVIINEEDT